MNPDLEKELERRIGLVLQGLPDLTAPPELLTRTMAAVQRAALGSRRYGAKWPLPARLAFVALGLVVAAVVCLGWRSLQPGIFAMISTHLAPAADGLSCFWKFISALSGAVVLAMKHMGTGFILACLYAAAAGWALCAGAGTIFVRFAFAKPGKNP